MNNFIVSSQYSTQIINIICLHTVISFLVFLSNTNSHMFTRFQASLKFARFDSRSFYIIVGHESRLMLGRHKKMLDPLSNSPF